MSASDLRCYRCLSGHIFCHGKMEKWLDLPFWDSGNRQSPAITSNHHHHHQNPSPDQPEDSAGGNQLKAKNVDKGCAQMLSTTQSRDAAPIMLTIACPSGLPFGQYLRWKEEEGAEREERHPEQCTIFS
jgi:hypothetical protein